MNASFRTTCVILLSCSALLAPSSFSQGPLAPAAAPAPTMKTLQQVEPRIDVATLPGDSNYHHIISQPGSYYLSGNLAVTKAHGIDVRAARVTIDLNGFQIARTGGSGGQGIEVDVTADHCTVKNGSISGFDYGLRCIFSLGSTARAGAVLDVVVSGCATNGILGGDEWQFTRLNARANGTGIKGGDGSKFDHCTATGNTIGISGNGGSMFTNCVAVSNASFGFVATGSTLMNCLARSNGSDGISGGIGSRIVACSANLNQGDGIHVLDDSLVKDNYCDGNGVDAAEGAGIHVSGSDNRIEGNNVTDNDRGLYVRANGNLIVKNSASGNTTNFDLVAGNTDAQVITPGAAFTTASPWANFAF